MVHVRLEEIEKYALDYNVPIMQKEGINFLTDYIKNNNVKKILEIGSAIGYSAIKMALVDEKINITTVEKDKNRYDVAVENIEKLNLRNRINIIYTDALDLTLSDTYDLVFIDAAKSQYIKFFEKFDKNLKVGGVIITDNLLFHGLVEDESKIKSRNTRQLVRKIKNYITYLKENKNYSTQFYEVGDGIAVSIKKNNN